jgi:hypothetical protein
MDDILAKAKAVLSTTPNRWLILVDHLPAELLETAPAEGEWPAVACLRHLIATEQRLYPPRVRAFLEGRDFEPFNPNAEGQDKTEPTPRELVEEFAATRVKSLALLDTLSDDDLSRTATHPDLGRVKLGDMLHAWAAHDLMHTRQAEQAIMQPFVMGCGPWQRYFTGHYIGGVEE